MFLRKSTQPKLNQRLRKCSGSLSDFDTLSRAYLAQTMEKPPQSTVAAFNVGISRNYLPFPHYRHALPSQAKQVELEQRLSAFLSVSHELMATFSYKRSDTIQILEDLFYAHTKLGSKPFDVKIRQHPQSPRS